MSWLLAARALPWKVIGFAALGLALALSIVALKLEQRHSAKLQAQVIACSEARKADRAAYEAAQAEAARKNIEQVRSKEAQQKRLNDNAVSNLSARLELLRRELRVQTGTDQGSPGVPGSPQAGGGPSPPGEARVCVEASKLLRGAENEERHDELISLVEQLIRLSNED